MRLKKLQLRDFRCFDQLEVTFSSDLNLVRGANGVGKTSVLEAIGFALFAVPPGRGSGQPHDAIREGCEQLSVELELELAGDDYVIARSLTVKGSDQSIKKQGARRLLGSSSEAVDSTLARLMQIADGSRLPLLFERLIGVAQGALVSHPELDADARRAHYSPLLNLDRYRLAATNVALAGAPFADRLQELDRQRETLEEERRGYHTIVERLAQAEHDQSDVDERVAAVEARILSLTEQETQLEQARQRSDELTLERAVLTETVRGRTAGEVRAAEQLAEAERAAAVVHLHRAGFDRWQDLEAECRAQELRRAEFGDARSEVDKLESRLAEERARIDGERDSLSALLETNQEETEQIFANRDGLRSQLEAIRAQARRADGAQSALVKAVSAGERLHSLVEGIDPEPTTGDERAAQRERAARSAAEEAERAAGEALVAEIEALEARADTLDHARANLAQARDSAHEIDRLRDQADAQLRELEPAHGACPFLREPCRNIGGISLLDHFAGEHERLAASRETALEAVRLASEQVDEAEEAKRGLAAKKRDAEARREAKAEAQAATRKDGPRDPHQTEQSGRSCTVEFDEIGHQLSSLAGVVGALEPFRRKAESTPVALIGSVAGEGSPGPAPEPIEVDFPSLEEIEQTHILASEGASLRRDKGVAGRERRITELSLDLATRLRKLHTSIVRTQMQMNRLFTSLRERSQRAERSTLDASRRLEELAVERSRIRATTKTLSAEDLSLLETETALGEARVRLGKLERIDAQLVAKRREQEGLAQAHREFQGHVLLAQRVEPLRDEWKRMSMERQQASSRLQQVQAALEEVGPTYDADTLAGVRREREEAHRLLGETRESARSLVRELELLRDRIDELEAAREQLEQLEQTRARLTRGVEVSGQLATLYRQMAEPVARRVMEGVSLTAERRYRVLSGREARLRWDEQFAVTLAEPSGQRSFSQLGHGDRASAALAIQLALLEQFPRLGLLLLDEPTAHLDRDRRRSFAEALTRIVEGREDNLEQIIVVSHDDTFDELAAHHIILGEPARQSNI